MVEYAFFSAAYRPFSKMSHILEHKAKFNKFKKTGIIFCTLSDHNGIKLEINNKRNYRKYLNT
jgi:hypothetical protein